MTTTKIEIKPYELLTKAELYAVMVLRNRVFVVGQKITAEPEVDGLDDQCHHALLWHNGELKGTARLFMETNPVKIGRVAVDTELQGKGLGTILMEDIQKFLGSRRAVLHAQAHLEAWYTRLGWRRVGEVFEEAQIPHVTMVWDRR